MTITALGLDFQELNKRIRAAEGDVLIERCYGQRFIGSGFKENKITIDGTPGNALGAYLDGAEIEVRGNAQDAVGDTMNAGKIIVRGNAGDALGYAMRGGEIFIQGNSGYRTGIHMKQYKEKRPVIVVGGHAGSFLGEYLAGGLIIVLGIGVDRVPVGNFTGTGMHGGRIYIRTDRELTHLPEQVDVATAGEYDMSEIAPFVERYAALFGADAKGLLGDRFCVLRPNAKDPYRQMYTYN